MRPGLGFTPSQSVHPFLGLNTTNPSTLINPSLSPNCINVTVTDGNVKKRKGYIELGSLSTGGLPVMEVISFQDGSGNTHLVAVTTQRFYIYDYTTNSWIDRTNNAFSGDDTKLISWVAATGTDTGRVLIITNGVDKPKYWTGDPTELFLDVEFNLPNFVTCQTLAYMNDTLIMGNVTTTDAAPQTVVWANAGQVNEWQAGTSGADTIYDAVGPIVAMMPLANSMVIYSEDSIHVMIFVGGDAVYTFQKVVENTRLTSAKAIINIGPYHLYMSQENIQLFDGSTTTTAVADVVHESYRRNLANNLLSKTFAFLDRARRRAYFAVPVNLISGGYRIDFYVLEYNARDLSQWKWALQNYAKNITSMNFYVRDTTAAWDSLTLAGLSWATASGPWLNSSATKGFPTRVLGTSDGHVMMADETVNTDNGTQIDAVWESIDFTIPQEYQSEYGRFLEIEVELKGTAVDLYYSVDEGQTYTTAQISLPLVANKWGFYRVPIDVVSRKLRVKVENLELNGALEMRFLRVWFAPTGPY
jgi:hypothetical protein